MTMDEPDQPVASPPAAKLPIPPGPVEPVPRMTLIQRSTGPNMLVRAAWFLFIGWWLSGLAITVAYVLCITIIGLPVGFMIFNRLPAIITLRPRTERHVTEVRDGVTYVTGGRVEQFPLWARAVYFLLIGWWVGAIYLSVAWFLCVLIITLPLGLLLINRVGAVMTLLRY